MAMEAPHARRPPPRTHGSHGGDHDGQALASFPIPCCLPSPLWWAMGQPGTLVLCGPLRPPWPENRPDRPCLGRRPGTMAQSGTPGPAGPCLVGPCLA